MQIREVRRGMIEAVGKTVVIITPNGRDPENEHGPLAVSFERGGQGVTIRSNCFSDSSCNIIGDDAIRHIHEALGIVLQQRAVAAVYASKQS